jgi:hypothetical protein
MIKHTYLQGGVNNNSLVIETEVRAIAPFFITTKTTQLAAVRISVCKAVRIAVLFKKNSQITTIKQPNGY